MLSKQEQSENLLTFNQAERSSFNNQSIVYDDNKTPVNFFQSNDICFPSPVHHDAEDNYLVAPAKIHLVAHYESNQNNLEPKYNSFFCKLNPQNESENILNPAKPILLFDKSGILNSHFTPQKDKNYLAKEERISSSEKLITSSKLHNTGITSIPSKKASFQSVDSFQTKPLNKDSFYPRDPENNSFLVNFFF